MAEKFDYEERWPELFELLDDEQRWGVRQAIAINWQEGWDPTREDVADLVDEARGVITVEEYKRRAGVKADRIVAAEAAEAAEQRRLAEAR